MLRAAALAAQLPHEGRVMRTISPATAHSDELRMLRLIEHNQRKWHWAHTEAAKRGAEEPQPRLLDGEEELFEAARDEQRKVATEVAEAFSIDI